MSLEKKSVHVRLPPDRHMELSLLATMQGKDTAELAAILLEKIIVGEFHALKATATSMKALGILRD